mgnify:CR=1 FL=1
MANEFKVRKGLIVQGSGSAGDETILDVQGNSGQLFSVTDDLTGTLFTVSDISGIPIFEVSASGVSTFDGNVGIGTTSPNADLQVEGSVRIGDTTTGVRLARNGDDFEMFGLDVAGAAWNSIHLKADGNDGVYIEKDTNNVGIGTTSPGEKLDVDGNILADGLGIGNNTIYSNSINLNNAGSLRIGNAEFISKSSNDMSIFQSKMVVTSAGNVGIGTTSPSTKLHVFEAGTSMITVDSGATSPYKAGIEFLRSSTNGGSIYNDGNNVQIKFDSYFGYDSANPSRGGFQFRTAPVSNNTMVDAVRIDALGNVGIGTTSPNNNLHIKTDTNGDGITIQRDSTSNGDYADLMFSITDTDSASPATKIRAIRGTSYGDTDMLFITDTDEAMRIDSSGRVGIGTSTITEKLHVNGSTGVDTAVRVDTTNADAELKLTVLGQKDWTLGVDYSDSGKFKIADSGTVGTNPRFTIDTSGNVGIGETSPSAKLQVAGDVSISTDAHVREKFLAGEDALPQSDHTLANGGSSAITPSSFAVDTVSGQILTSQTSGQALENGVLVYLRSDGKWHLADADQTATSTSLLGIALKDAASADRPTDILIDGVIGIKQDYITFSNIGEPLYVDTSAGKMTNTAPSGGGDVVRVVGHYLGADSTATGVLVAFKPDGMWIEL